MFYLLFLLFEGSMAINDPRKQERFNSRSISNKSQLTTRSMVNNRRWREKM